MKKYYDALNYAAKLHDGQTRKGTKIPYITHLMTVSSYVFEFGGSIDQAIAGLLHDSLEDCGKKTSSEEIEKLFGSEVARIVIACTDTQEDPKPSWRPRKEAYLKKLKDKDQMIKLVVACDKLHNAQSIVKDVTLYGPSVWERFSAPSKDQIWYYEGIVNGLSDLNSPIIKLLSYQVSLMKSLAT